MRVLIVKRTLQTLVTGLQRHAKIFAQGRTIISCPSQKVEALQTA